MAEAHGCINTDRRHLFVCGGCFFFKGWLAIVYIRIKSCPCGIHSGSQAGRDSRCPTSPTAGPTHHHPNPMSCPLPWGAVPLLDHPLVQNLFLISKLNDRIWCNLVHRCYHIQIMDIWSPFVCHFGFTVPRIACHHQREERTPPVSFP